MLYYSMKNRGSRLKLFSAIFSFFNFRHLLRLFMKNIFDYPDVKQTDIKNKEIISRTALRVIQVFYLSSLHSFKRRTLKICYLVFVISKILRLFMASRKNFNQELKEIIFKSNIQIIKETIFKVIKSFFERVI